VRISQWEEGVFVADSMFKKGDVVQLASGGPRMTIYRESEAGQLWCEWFDAKGNKQSDEFDPATLVKTPAKQGPTIATGKWRHQ
jgi:uncharacterized protein YodC (DUF2158 family)